MTAILGISAYYHDSAAALVVDGRIIAAAQEERFTRKKHDASFPTHAVRFCLDRVGLTPGDLDGVAFYDKPLLKFERLLETYLAYAPRGLTSFLAAMPVWLREKLHLRRELDAALGHAYRKQYVFTEHHESHAASAFFPSPFDEAAILTIDGVGEWATASYGYGRGNTITLTHELRFPHSLGLLYSAFTYFCGFSVNSGEYKLMGLAPYGEPRFVDDILTHVIDLKQDGSFRMEMSFFNYCQGLTMTSKRFERLFGGPPRPADGPLTEREMDLAASIQKVTEEIMLRAARHVARETGMKKLCMAGGVALNCVANGRILREGLFDDIWIQPAAGDAGGALGAALFTWHHLFGQPRPAKMLDSQAGSLLGPSFSDDEIRTFLEQEGAIYEEVPDEALCAKIADRLKHGDVVGWFQGPMEFGPRALGNRSLLGDPRDERMQAAMNLKVKFREGFRPFAPSVLREHVADYFETRPNEDSPYMLLVAPIRENQRRSVGPDLDGVRGLDKLRATRSEIPAVTHVDYSARIQTVDRARFPLYHRLLAAYRETTGCAVLVNTSFNLGWDPVVCTPADAYHTFMSSEIDLLCMGHFVVKKEDQPAYVPATISEGPEVLLADLWRCPCGRDGALLRRAEALFCSSCGNYFSCEGGVPDLFWPQTEQKDLLAASGNEAHDRDAFRRLLEYSRRDPYVCALNESIPFNTTVLVVGCADGALPSVLAASCRRVVGTDERITMLRGAERLRRAHGLRRTRFVRMNPRHPCFRSERFDVVICQCQSDGLCAGDGVAVGALTPLLRPGGFLVATQASLSWLPASKPTTGRSVRAATPTLRGIIRAFQQADVEIVRAWTSTDDIESGHLFDAGDHRPTTIGVLDDLRQVVLGARGAAALVVGRRPLPTSVKSAGSEAVYDGAA